MINGLTAKDPDAWHRFVQIMGPVIYQWCRRAGLQNSDAADVLQEVLLTVSEKLVNFRKTSAEHTFRGWLRKVTTNKIRDRWRVGRRVPPGVGGTDANARIHDIVAEEHISEVDETAAEPSQLNSDRLILRRALSAIRGDCKNENTWKAFSRTTFQRVEARVVAKELGMSPAAVRQAKCRVTKRLLEETAGLLSMETRALIESAPPTD